MVNKYYIYNGCKFSEGFSPVLINMSGPYYLEGSFTSRGFEWDEVVDPFLETSAREDSLIYECTSEEDLYNAYKALIEELGNFSEFGEEVINFIKNFKNTYKGD